MNKSYIRVESDEVTYPLHVILRFNLEQKIFNENINLRDIPELWNEEYKRLFDKKVELESQAISDLPDWSFLPEKELQRNAILLFSNQRSAKRICSRNQRVIKIPNTSIFKLSKSYHLSPKKLSDLLMLYGIV